MTSTKLKRDPVDGEKVWMKPANPAVPVPYEVSLRGGILSGQRGHPVFPPAANQVLDRRRVPKMTGPEEVAWSTWWRRRYVQGDAAFCSKEEIAKAKAATKKAEDEAAKAAKEAAKAGGDK